MTQRQGILFVLGFVVVGIVAGTLWTRRARTVGGDEEAPREQLEVAVEGSVSLYFPGSDGRLHEEVRGIDTGVEGAALAVRVLENVLSGPDAGELFAPLPESTTVGGAFLAADGTLYLDLASSEHATPPVAGSQREILAAYSLVNSVCANVPGVQAVALLWNGEQRTTFAGNLDTTRPLVPNRRLVAAG